MRSKSIICEAKFAVRECILHYYGNVYFIATGMYTSLLRECILHYYGNVYFITTGMYTSLLRAHFIYKVFKLLHVRLTKCEVCGSLSGGAEDSDLPGCYTVSGKCVPEVAANLSACIFRYELRDTEKERRDLTHILRVISRMA